MYKFSKKHIQFQKDITKIFAQFENTIDQSTYDSYISELEKLKILGLLIPEKYGGYTIDFLSATLLIYELAKRNSSLAHVLSCHTFGFSFPINQFGSTHQKEKYLTKIVDHNCKGTLAITEPTGIMPSSIKLTAKGSDGFYVLNGNKCMITNAVNSDFAIVLVKTNNIDSDTPTFNDFSLLIVDLKETDGITIGVVEETMGMENVQISEILFEDAKIPKSQVLGEEGQAFKLLFKIFEYSRIINASVALGIAETAFNEGVRYAKQRMLNGKPLIINPIINQSIARSQIDLKTINLLTFYNASLIENTDESIYLNAAISKMCVTEKAKSICDSMLQIFGGYGYVKKYNIEKLYRDIRIHTILGGSSEIILNTVVNEILKTN